MRRFTIASFLALMTLVVLDALTTEIALAEGCYEVNPFVRTFLLNDFFLELKVILTALAFFGMFVLLSERLFKVCCFTVLLFYSIVVLNNLGAISGSFDFHFTMPKLTLLALTLFLISLKAIPSSPRRP